MSIADKLQTIAENEQKVFEAGKKSEYDEFWDKYQDNGNRVNYQYGFAGDGWNKNNFKPKYSMRPTQMSTGFWKLGSKDADIENAIDFVEVFDDRGLVFDTSNNENFTSAFMWANIKRLGVIDIRKNSSAFSTVFAYGKIKTIEKLIVDENVVFQSNTFQNQATLENITIEGVIGTSVAIAQASKLTIESMRSIIAALKDFGGTTTTATLTLHATAKAKLIETDIANITQKGWTLA